MQTISLKKNACASALLLWVASLAYGAQPPNVVVSDANANTAMGTDALANLTIGSWNTAAGLQALLFNTSGDGNTAFGYQALLGNTTGLYNTATGQATLSSNTTGSDNTATGSAALFPNTTGSANTATGSAALANNTTASGNTATGFAALYQNTTGSGNTASGYGALSTNTTGENNTSSGQQTLTANTTGFSNSAIGGSALGSNTTGAQNTAIGGAALLSNTTGNNNVGVGMNAGFNITTGGQNIVIGLDAGSNLTTGNADIDIGNVGVAGEGHTIRIGNASQHTKVFMAGIWGHIVKPGSPVFVGPDGNLGVVASSERYKTDIVPMGSSTSKIGQLRPVTFHLKSDATGELQYGLIAEEVDRVFPELVVRDEAGRIEGVRYDELAPILLNEVQQQQQKLSTQADLLAELKQQFAELQEVNRAMRVALEELQAKDSRVAMR